MKKQLLGTTTLVAAGLLVAGGPAQQANAAEPITMGFGGNYTAAVVFWDQGDTGGGLRDHAIEDTGEIQFSGSTDLDNGINVGVRIEYEAFNSGRTYDSDTISGMMMAKAEDTSIIDDTHIAFSGGFGILRVGSNANVASAMHYENPSGAWEFSVNSPSHAVISGSGNAMTSFIGTYQFTTGDQEGIFYYTPRINGIQFGVSYQPDDVQYPGVTASGSGDTTTGVQDNVWAFGLNYQGSFDEVSISGSAGYLTGSEESDSVDGEGTDSFSLGLTIGWDAFNVGGAYKHSDNGVVANGDLDVFAVSFNHTTGDLTWGLEYAYGEQETGAGTEDGLSAFGISATYGLGPGISFITGIKYYDYDTDTVGRASPDGAAGGFGVVTYF